MLRRRGLKERSNLFLSTVFIPVSTSIKLYLFPESTGFFYRLQTGYRPADSIVKQMVFIVHKIHEALDRGSEAVFLCISKAFDKVWHAGLLAKLQHLGR